MLPGQTQTQSLCSPMMVMPTKPPADQDAGVP
jgi:hypothetical protein